MKYSNIQFPISNRAWQESKNGKFCSDSVSEILPVLLHIPGSQNNE